MPYHTNRTLPAEILEMFIDTLGRCLPIDSDSRRVLQTCSLVSRSFRNRAHHYLFSEIEFVQQPYSTPSNILIRLWNFRELVHAGLKLPLTPLLYHTRSFNLVMDGSLFEAHAILKNEDLVCIMRLLQEHSWDICTIAMQGSSFPIVWPDLKLNFRAAFTDLCRSSKSLTTLHLENIVGVPYTIVWGTTIKHVRFHLIEFAESSADYTRHHDLPHGQLESIDIDYTFPFPANGINELEGMHKQVSTALSQSSFSQIKTLKYLIYRSDDLQKFVIVAQGIASTLEAVDLELSNSDNGFLRALTWVIPFDHFQNLRRLHIRHKSLVSVGTRHPLIKVATILRSMGVPHSLETVELTFTVRSQPPWLKAAQFFPEARSWAMIDSALTHERFALVRNIVFHMKYFTIRSQPWTFDERMFTDRCFDFIKDVLPLIASSKMLDVTVSVFSNTDRPSEDS